jgi:hypothetical protein
MTDAVTKDYNLLATPEEMKIIYTKVAQGDPLTDRQGKILLIWLNTHDPERLEAGKIEEARAATDRLMRQTHGPLRGGGGSHWSGQALPGGAAPSTMDSAILEQT